MNFTRTAVVLLMFAAASCAYAQSSALDDCPTPINGALRGEPGNIQDHMFHSLAIDPTNENIVYAGTETNGVFKTADGGVTWTRLRIGFKCTVQKTGYSQIFDIAIDPTNPQILYASAVNGPGPSSPSTFTSASGGIYKSTDGGLTWTQKNQGLTNTYVTYVLIDSTNPNRLYAGVGGLKSTFAGSQGVFYDGGVWVSDNAGDSWSPLTLPAGISTNVFIDMVLRGANQRILYASAQSHGTDAPIGYGLLRSGDGGQTWAIVNPAGQTISGFDVFRGDPNIVYGHDLSNGRRVHRSTDAGSTWVQLQAGFFGVVRIHPANSQVMYFTGRTSILKTSDGFLSQQEVYNDPDLPSYSQMVDIKIAQTNPNVVWAAAKGYYLYKTADGGQTWRKITAIRDLVYGDPPSSIASSAIVNAASYDASAVAPGSLASIFGVFPNVNTAQAATSPWPTTLSGLSVTFNGILVPLHYVSATQLNVQVPWQMAGQTQATVIVTFGGQSSVARQIAIAGAAPGVFQTGSQQGIITDALSGRLISSSNPAQKGSTYLTIYCTGLGAVMNQPATGAAASASVLSPTTQTPTVTIGGVPASIGFSGLAPGFTGLYQIDVRVPAGAPTGNAVPLVVAMAGRTASAVTIAIIPAGASPFAWAANAKVSGTGEYMHGGRAYASSSSLRVEWRAPDVAVHHYVIVASEKRSSVQVEAPGSAKEAVLRDLKAGTVYTANLRACLNPDCSGLLQSQESVTATTGEEYWRIQGRGNSYATADRLVADGNVGSYAFLYGKWAGAELDGKIQLYYVPQQGDEKGAKIGEMIAPRADSIEAASAFRGISGYGLLRVCQQAPGTPGSAPALPPECVRPRSLVIGLNLFQAVPLTAEAGGKVRLFFEAGGGDGRTRILYLDSQDGYAGRDFHAGASTRCSSLQDYSAGGGCEPKIAVGVDVDGGAGNTNVLNARQFKIGYPTQDSWAWDMKPGTFMWFTTEWPDRRCSEFNFNAAYAVWSGTRWNVEYQPGGCPKLLAGAQAPAVVHLGGGRYKLYFNLHPSASGPTNPQIALKPMRMLYADPSAAGDPGLVDFEDWEPMESARKIHYLWASGEMLTEAEESRLDDYVVFAPTSDPRQLIMYSNMSAGGVGGVPFIGSAVLVNP